METTEITKNRVGRPTTIADEKDRKRKHSASITPRQYERIQQLFPPSGNTSTFEQVVIYAISHKEKEISKKDSK